VADKMRKFIGFSRTPREKLIKIHKMVKKICVGGLGNPEERSQNATTLNDERLNLSDQ
jgi:hypothetical protein